VCVPPPPPECKPGQSHAVGIDTAHIQPGYFKYHIDLLPAPVNSDQNDNGIAFYHTRAIVSAERTTESAQRIFISEMLADLHFYGLNKLDGDSFEQTGAAQYCAADEKLYFTAKVNNDDPDDYAIYSAKLIGNPDKLSEIQSLSVLNKPHTFDAQPAISKDGLMIVFASDRAGGYGGVDLWYSKRKSLHDEWQEPKPLPPTVNTACDELSPSFSVDGKTLYFSSDGHETIGGYDIFSSEIKDGEFMKAVNIGSPINTRSDEIFPYQLSDSQFFYTSDQPASFKGRNIFVLRRTYVPPKDITEKIPEKKHEEHQDRHASEKDTSHPKDVVSNIPDTIQLHGTVEMQGRHDSVLPEVFLRDVQKGKEIARKPTDTVGNYSFRVEKGREYDVGSDLKDKFYDVHRVDLRHPTDSVITVPPLIIPDTLVLRINFPFDDDSHPYDFTINDNGQKSEIRWQTSLDLLAKSITNSSATLAYVTLYGHTDSLGTDEYNYGLASRRANFVATQLRSRGIPGKLLHIVSKGKTMPLARVPGESDETYQLRCRRVEFVKIFTKPKTR
jgi:hypothetical protein